MADEKPKPTKGVTHEQAMAEPDRYTILSNGAIKDNETGYFVGNPGGGKTALTRAHASLLSTQRWKAAREKFASGLVAGTPGLSANATPIDAWEAVGAKSAELLHSSRSARGFAELARFAGQAGDFMPGDGKQEGGEKVRVEHATVNLVAVIAREMAVEEEDIIDVEAE